jgi:hypothetical protein
VKRRKASNNMQGVPVWELGGIICTGETYKDCVKPTLHTAKLEIRRAFSTQASAAAQGAIDFRKDDKVNENSEGVREDAWFNAGRPSEGESRKKKSCALLRPQRFFDNLDHVAMICVIL